MTKIDDLLKCNVRLNYYKIKLEEIGLKPELTMSEALHYINTLCDTSNFHRDGGNMRVALKNSFKMLFKTFLSILLGGGEKVIVYFDIKPVNILLEWKIDKQKEEFYDCSLLIKEINSIPFEDIDFEGGDISKEIAKIKINTKERKILTINNFYSFDEIRSIGKGSQNKNLIEIVKFTNGDSLDSPFSGFGEIEAIFKNSCQMEELIFSFSNNE